MRRTGRSKGRSAIGHHFETTRWSVVLAARTADSAGRREALATLCEAYWAPLYAFIRRHGRSPEDAADLTQSFFAHLLEEGTLTNVDPGLGRFRTFLLVSVKNFLANEWKQRTASKRGGQWTRVPFEPSALERRYVAVSSEELDPERLFDRHWALTVLDRALDRLRVQHTSAEKQREFKALAPFLTSDGAEGRSYRDVGAELRMSDVAVRAAVHRLRRRFGIALRDEISDTVSDRAATDAEIRHVLAVASG
jgi:RNA polymerase sigma-70 factor (ECF subfamily)